jgi:hypothetical protein
MGANEGSGAVPGGSEAPPILAHTPGPWRACVWDPMERPHVHADLPGERVCNFRRDLPLTAADAHLIAAAPDLLAALRRLVAVTEQYHSEDPDCSVCHGWRPDEHAEDCDLTIARAAIAKAEGR